MSARTPGMAGVSAAMSSVVIPAHNEAAVIGRCLSSILMNAEPGEFEVVVVCNGCNDKTAEIARSFGRDVRVAELPVASKAAALNAGDALATRFPRHFIDADIEVRADDIRRVDAALRAGTALVAAPRVAVDTRETAWGVRAFWRIWLRLPYATSDLIGAGYYGMSEEARGRFRQFPDIVADDVWAQHLVDPGERMAVQGATFIFRPPQTLSAQIRVRVRHLAANRVYREDIGGGAAEEDRRQRAGLVKLLPFPWLWPSLVVYVGVNLAARALSYRTYREKEHTWSRDDTTRTVAPRGDGGAGMQMESSRRRRWRRIAAATRSVFDPRVYVHALKLLHYYHYTHISERPKVAQGADIRFAPNVSIVAGELIRIGDRAHISARCSLWAGPTSGRITIGNDVLMAPDVFITTSNYSLDVERPMGQQPKVERDVVIGDDVWLGTRVIVLPGVTIGDGCVVGAGSVVTASLPPGSVAVGAPARVVTRRESKSVRIEPTDA